MTDRFIVEPDPRRKNGWRVMRRTEAGQSYATPGRFRKEHKAQAAAYEMTVAAERRARAPYLGD